MPTEEGKVPRKRANSKSELNEFKLKFEDIKDEFKKLRDMYLAPLLETNGRISNQLKKMEDDVNRNSLAIEECQREIAELRQTRLIALLKHSVRDDVKVREEFMIENYPNIWLEYMDSKSKKYLIGAFYRVWGKNQHKEMAEIVSSIDAVCEENRDTLIVSDMNLNKLRFNDKDYPY